MQKPDPYIRTMNTLLCICVNGFTHSLTMDLHTILIDKHTLLCLHTMLVSWGMCCQQDQSQNVASVTSHPLAFGALNRLGDQPSEPPVDAHPQSSPSFNHAITHTLNASLLQHAFATLKVQPYHTAHSMQSIAGISYVTHAKMKYQIQTLRHSITATC